MNYDEKKNDKTVKEKTQDVPLSENTEGKRRGRKSGVGRLERMKRGSGMKGREDKSNGIEILITESFVKINPTEPLRLSKQAARRKRN